VYVDSDFANETSPKIINLSSLAQGMYVCRVVGTSGVQLTRLIKSE